MPTRKSTRLALAAAALLVAGAARAQVTWVGAAVGKSWEYQPDSQPDRTWLEGDTHAVNAFLAIPLDDHTYVRLDGYVLPHTALSAGLPWRGKFRAYTLGVDYLFPGTFGRAVFSGGVGQYTFRADSSIAPGDIESSSFGWYVGVGEWFELSPRVSLTAEITMHRPVSRDRPTLMAGLVGLAVAF